MKVLTEIEAQQLADLLGCHIAVDGETDRGVYVYEDLPIRSKEFPFWLERKRLEHTRLPIGIWSNKPWTSQIWHPSKQQEPPQ